MLRSSCASLLCAFATLLSTTSSSSLDPRQTIACNNSPNLCSRAYNSITHLGAHDSAFVRDSSTDFSVSGNQFYNSSVQLSAGVRLLTAQVHLSNGEWHLCHSSCDLLDAGLLSNWLSEIKSWLDSNPDDVVTVLLVNSDNASPTDLSNEFSTSGITSYAYIPTSTTSPPATWPTLQELITANTRLVTFVASLTGVTAETAYLMDEFTFIYENPFEVTSSSNFSCEPSRPSSVENNIAAALSSNRMFLMNHFLDKSGIFDIETPDVDVVSSTNSPGDAVGNLGYSLSECSAQYSGKAPTFVLVDFFDQGPAIDAVDAVNSVTEPVGRIAVPARDAGATSRTESSFLNVIALVEQVKAGSTPKLGAWIWAAGEWTWGGINLSGGQVLAK